MKKEVWIRRFEDDLLMRGFSPRTIEGYLRELTRLLAFLSERGITKVSEVTKDCLAAYRTHLYYRTHRGKRAGLAAQANKLSAVKAFFHFLVRSDYLLVDPSKELTLPRTLKKLPSQLVTETEVERLLQTPDIALPLGLRDRAILELLYATAIRNKELLELEIDHVDLARGELFVARGKGNKSRRLPVGEEALAWVETYLLKVRPGIARSDSGKTLFLSYRGRMLDRANLAALVRRHVKACGLEKRVTPHVLRHACVTHMLKRGASVRHAQLILGHTGLHSTQHYLRLEISDLHRALRQFHPREQGFAQDPLP